MESLLSACNTGRKVSSFQKDTEQFLLGHNKSYVALCQIWMVGTAFRMVERAGAALPTMAYWSAYTLSVGTALAIHYTQPTKHQTDRHLFLRKGLYWVHRNLGSALEATAFGASLWAATYGDRLAGSATAAIMAFNYLHRNSLTPRALDPVYRAQTYLGLIWTFGWGSWPMRALDGSLIAATYAKPERARDDFFLPIRPRTWRQAFEFGKGRFCLDWAHIDQASEATIPQANPATKVEALKNFTTWLSDWSETARSILAADDNWTSIPRPDKDKAEYLAEGIRKIVDKVTGNDPSFVGKPAELPFLRNLLCLLVEKYGDASIDESERVVSFCRLAAHGHYCGEGYLAVAQNEYFYLTNQTNQLGFEGAVKRVLSERRKALFDAALYEMFSQPLWGLTHGLRGADTAENQLQYLRSFGPLCGHPWVQTGRAAANSDSWTNTALDRFLRIALGGGFLWHFYPRYNAKEIISTVQAALKEKRITQAKLNEALQPYCDQTGKDVMDAFEWRGNLELKDEWVGALLAQYGILKEKEGGHAE